MNGVALARDRESDAEVGRRRSDLPCHLLAPAQGEVGVLERLDHLGRQPGRLPDLLLAEPPPDQELSRGARLLGRDPTPPGRTRADSTTPPVPRRTFAATPSTGESSDPPDLEPGCARGSSQLLVVGGEHQLAVPRRGDLQGGGQVDCIE